MKAIRIHGFGTPDGVSFDEIERPEVGPADALVQIESASVNPLDVKMLILRGGSLLSANSRFRFKTLGFHFEPEIVTFEPHPMLVWSAKGPSGASGSYAWYIEPRPGGCRVITEESQIGWVLFFLRARTRGRLLESHQEWLRSLMERAEASRD
jgi:hypothetical protein